MLHKNVILIFRSKLFRKQPSIKFQIYATHRLKC